MKKAFTLAEVMIVLVVIGILVAILLPTVQNLTPDEALMKFQKAHNTIHTAIRKLVNSDKYYATSSFDVIYKIFCLDIDKLNQVEDPFRYGIRADGKIINGARAQKWLEESI